MEIIQKIRRRGVRRAVALGPRYLLDRVGIRKRWYMYVNKNAEMYRSPTIGDLLEIEAALASSDIFVCPFTVDPNDFQAFLDDRFFPDSYHGGRGSAVWTEKLLEHYVAYKLLGLNGYAPNDVYIDVAASGSPWAKVLRERLGIEAYAIDLEIACKEYGSLPYYKKMDATQMQFQDSSVRGMSLQCAYEMFMGDSDIRFINEVNRVLKPGGKVVINPLYMHTHYCGYASPDWYGKGYADEGAKEYIRSDVMGIPFSRKYDALMLQRRVLERIVEQGLSYNIYALRNGRDLGNSIYLHFILEITK